MITQGKELSVEDKVTQVESEVNGFKVIERLTAIDIIIPETGYNSGCVTVYKPTDRFGEKDYPAEINWSALGSQFVPITQRMIEALQLAVEYANQLNKETQNGRTK